jgi:hypothetical protein
MKNCGKCKKTKPEDDFYDCASTVDGKEGHVQENLTIAKNLMDYIKKYKEEEN